MAHAPSINRSPRPRVVTTLLLALASIIAINFFGGVPAGATSNPPKTEECEYGYDSDYNCKPCPPKPTTTTSTSTTTSTTSTTSTTLTPTTSTTSTSTTVPATTSTTVTPTTSTTSTSSTLPPYIGVPTSIVNASLPPAPPTTTGSTTPPVRELAHTGSNGPTWMLILGLALVGSGIAVLIRNRRAHRAKA